MIRLLAIVLALWGCIGSGLPALARSADQPVPASSIIDARAQRLTPAQGLAEELITRSVCPGEAPIRTVHPFDGALLPANMAPIIFNWTAEAPVQGPWLLRFRFAQAAPLDVLTDSPSWTPSPAAWKLLRLSAGNKPVSLRILSASGATGRNTSFRFSRDPVNAPILYQQMPLPITRGLANPASFQWLVADPASVETPRVVLEKQPVCGMCHSTSADGSTFAMDLDAGGDKGAFALADVAPDIRLDTSSLHTWTGFQDDGKTTLGLFPALSPNGHFLVATVEERSMFVTLHDRTFSECFFPIRGKLAYHSRRMDFVSSLPGADLDGYSQAGAAFSPDGATVVFSRAPSVGAYEEAMGSKGFLSGRPGETIHDYNARYPVRFDLHTLPFNYGYGGTAQPLPGASDNGHSNYWPRYSPDGRFIVFVRAPNGMMNQPDSELMVIPAGGGSARRLECSLPVHNSWHSFSPDGRWLVFVSKVYGAETQLFLAHFDSEGHSAPPVWLHRTATKGRASVLPDFMNVEPGTLRAIKVGFDAADPASRPQEP